MRALLLILAAVLLGCGQGNGGASDGPVPGDSGVPDAPLAGDQCVSHHGQVCHEGDVYWVDACGTREELKQACAADQQCSDGLCCTPPQSSGALQLPAHTIHVKWKLAQPLAELEMEVEIGNDPGEAVGLYLGLFNGQLDKTMFYFGIQTDVAKPGVGGVGKGLIFSRWATQDAADARIAPGGFIEVGSHEGNFVGVRLPYDWTTGSYKVTLARAESDGDADWFDMHVTDAAGTKTYVGGLRFPRWIATTPARIAAAGTTFTEVYSHAADIADVPQWKTAVMARGDGQLAPSAELDYPAYPYAEFPNTDGYYDKNASLVRLTFGGSTARCHAAGPLFP